VSVDPLPLAPGERALWQGRAALGAPWPPLVLLLLVGSAPLIIGAAVALGCVVQLSPDDVERALGLTIATMMIASIVCAAVITACLAARFVGPFHVSLTMLALGGTVFVLFWINAVSRVGWGGAVARLKTDDLVASAVFIGLPLARVMVGVWWTLEVSYVITDRRALAVRGSRVLWQTPRVGLRVERSHLVVGERWLRLRDDDPARVLDAVSG
jgi:hypothetical protein